MADLRETLQAAPSFKTLISAIKAAGLVEMLNGPGSFNISTRPAAFIAEISVLNDGAACNVSLRSAMSDFSFVSTVILSSSAVEVIVCTRLTDQNALIFYIRQYNIRGCKLSCPKRGNLPRSYPWTALVPKSHHPALIIHHAIVRRLSGWTIWRSLYRNTRKIISEKLRQRQKKPARLTS